jgi:DNA mismatch repair protein MutS
LKTASRYATSILDNINEKLNQCQEVIKEKEKEIFENFKKEILEISHDLFSYSKISAELDLFTNFANFSIEENCVKPILTNGNEFEVKNGRHPILQKILKEKGKAFVANDCSLSKSCMFMTGPNMAGKSTYLRQQALIMYLAHIGMFVPAEQATIGVIDKIFSRISTDDNLMEGNSTFMMEMIEVALTLNQASQKSFLILDEVGRGTCVEEGVAIAQAILEFILDKLNSRCIFATHYLELGKIEHTSLQKKMMHIDIDPVYFSYKIMDGVADKAYAINVAKMAGMPASIVERAQQLLDLKKN